MLNRSNYIWMDGKFVKWKDAKVHILAHTLHYGLGAFEGIRCYETAKGPAIFRLDDHVNRFFQSAHIFGIDMPFSNKAIRQSIIETVKINKLKQCYIRPIMYIGTGEMGVYPKKNPIHISIAAWPWGAYLGEDALKNGIKVKISSFIRNHVNSNMSRGKICGYYVNSQIALKEAIDCGCDEALMLDTEGFVSEGSGENIFIVRNGALKTTPLTSILDGITRNSILTVAQDHNVCCVEERFTRDEIYISGEAFFTGTLAEITPITNVDGRMIGNGKVGKLTKKLQSIYFDVVQGRKDKYKSWLTFI